MYDRYSLSNLLKKIDSAILRYLVLKKAI